MRDYPVSQETGLLRSFLCAGGMYRADEGTPFADDTVVRFCRREPVMTTS